jgi:hypothetical protein
MIQRAADAYAQERAKTVGLFVVEIIEGGNSVIVDLNGHEEVGGTTDGLLGAPVSVKCALFGS